MTNTMRRLAFSALLLCLGMLGLLGPGRAQAQDVAYYHTDALGTPVVMTDSSGNVIAGSRREFEPYGRQLSPTPVADGPGYTGHVSDAATGLSYMQQRYYDPLCGCFLSVDPETAYDSGDIRFFNRYAYAFNNPYKFNDPDGRCPECFGAAVGAGSDLLIQGALILAGAQDKIDWTDVGISAGSGALGVGLAGKVGRVGEMAIDAVTSISSKVAKGEEVTVKGVMLDVAAGQVGGKVAAGAMERKILNSAEHKVAQRQANRLERIAKRPDARAAQKARGQTAQSSLNNSVARRAAMAGIAGSNMASKGAEALEPVKTKDTVE